MRTNLSIMNMNIKSPPKNVHNDICPGVVIIFIIVALIFLLSLTKSNYSKELFSQKTEFRK